jgi:hypothetical protein
MSDYIGDYIHYRIEKSDQAYKDAFLFDSRQKEITATCMISIRKLLRAC